MAAAIDSTYIVATARADPQYNPYGYGGVGKAFDGGFSDGIDAEKDACFCYD